MSTQSNDDILTAIDTKLGAYVERLEGQFDQILEIVSDMQTKVSRISNIEETVLELRTDMKTESRRYRHKPASTRQRTPNYPPRSKSLTK